MSFGTGSAADAANTEPSQQNDANKIRAIMGGGSGQPLRRGLGLEAELGRLEGMRLGHRLLGPVQAVEDQLAKELVADAAIARDIVLLLAIDDEEMVPRLVAGEVDVLAQFDEALRAEDEGPSVTPDAQPVRSVPIDADLVRRAVVRDKGRLAEVLEFGRLGIRKVAHRRMSFLVAETSM